MYKSFVKLNGRDFPMMLGEHHLVLSLGLPQVRKWPGKSPGMLSWVREKSVDILKKSQGKLKLVYSADLKGHSHLCDCADLDTSFSHFEKSLPQPEIKVHLEIRFIFCNVLLDSQSFTEKPVFERPFAHHMILYLSYLVKNSIYRVSVVCKLAMERYVMRMCPSWLCPFNTIEGW